MNNAPSGGSRTYAVTAVVVLVNAATSVGFGVATTAQHGGGAWYGLDRAVALLGLAAAVVVARRAGPLVAVGWALAAVQAMDAAVGLAAGDALTGLGPVALAVLTAAAVLRLQRGRGPAPEAEDPAAGGTGAAR